MSTLEDRNICNEQDSSKKEYKSPRVQQFPVDEVVCGFGGSKGDFGTLPDTQP